jgi:tRNA threonylcarbamoyladenosine biosynthesis protein TsaE
VHSSFVSRTPEQTERAGALLAAQTTQPTVVCLVGDLGVGKTHFVKGLAQGLELDPVQVTSPTFAIVNEYGGETGRGLVHMDFYRLESESALEEVGFLDLLALDAILAIEWGDRFQQALPPDHLVVRIARERAGAAETSPPTPFPATDAEPSASTVPSPTESKETDSALRVFQVHATGPASGKLLDAWCEALDVAGLAPTGREN